jgi:hypothetical protein
MKLPVPAKATLTVSMVTNDVAPKQPGAGRIEVHIDGQLRATADLSTAGPRQAQQVVCEVTDLSQGKHSIAIIHRGSGPVAVDALIARE